MPEEEGKTPEPKPEDGKTPPEAPAAKEGQEPQGEAPKPPETFDREYVEKLRAEAAKNRKEAREATTELDEIKERDKTESQKNADKAAKLEAELKASKLEMLRFRVAGEKKIPPEAVEFLQGDDEEELRASADKLLKLTQDSVKSEFDGGARAPEAEPEDPVKAHNTGILQALGLSKQENP